MQQESVLFFLTDGMRNRVMIAKAQKCNLKQKIRQINDDYKAKFRLAGLVRSDDNFTQTAVHAKFSKFRHTNSWAWFTYVQPIKDFMNTFGSTRARAIDWFSEDDCHNAPYSRMLAWMAGNINFYHHVMGVNRFTFRLHSKYRKDVANALDNKIYEGWSKRDWKYLNGKDVPCANEWIRLSNAIKSSYGSVQIEPYFPQTNKLFIEK